MITSLQTTPIMQDTFRLEPRFGLPALLLTCQDANERNISQLQRFNAAIFPIRQTNKFYKQLLTAPPPFSRLVYHGEILVAAVCCTKEISKQSYTPSKLYIMTLGVLPTYRERGIGHKLITHVLELASSPEYSQHIEEVYLHVQDGNHEAFAFYEQHGFQIANRIVGYYKRLQPSDCFVVRKPVNLHLTQTSQQNNDDTNLVT